MRPITIKVDSKCEDVYQLTKLPLGLYVDPTEDMCTGYTGTSPGTEYDRWNGGEWPRITTLDLPYVNGHYCTIEGMESRK